METVRTWAEKKHDPYAVAAAIKDRQGQSLVSIAKKSVQT